MMHGRLPGAVRTGATPTLSKSPRTALHVRRHVRIAKCAVQGPGSTTPQAGPHTRQPLTTTLPNGLCVAYFNRAELDLFHDEIIGQCSYLAHGVHLKPGDTVVDVGANVGLFSLVAAQAVGRQGAVVAVEPLAEARHAAQLNAASLKGWCHGSCCMPRFVGAAVGAEPRAGVEMTTYDWATGWSSLIPDDDEVRANMMAYLDQLLAPQPATGAEQQGSEAATESMLEQNMLVRAGRLLRRLPLLSRPLEALAVEVMLRSKRTVSVPLTTVSGIIQDHALQRVDLLKVDVERAEMDLLRGIKKEDWHKICQLSLEVHDVACDTERVTSNAASRVAVLVHMLKQQGFTKTVVDQSPRMHGTNLYMVYATRG